MFDQDVLTSITWDALQNFWVLGLFLMIILQIFGKTIVKFLLQIVMWVLTLFKKFKYVPVAEEWEEIQDLVINLFTFGSALLITYFLRSETFTSGSAFVASVLATLIATGTYEVFKNMFSTSGYKWK